jgi:hypothetical protein
LSFSGYCDFKNHFQPHQNKAISYTLYSTLEK